MPPEEGVQIFSSSKSYGKTATKITIFDLRQKTGSLYPGSKHYSLSIHSVLCRCSLHSERPLPSLHPLPKESVNRNDRLFRRVCEETRSIHAPDDISDINPQQSSVTRPFRPPRIPTGQQQEPPSFPDLPLWLVPGQTTPGLAPNFQEPHPYRNS